MTATRFGRLQKATALVPLALLSVAWTASLAGVGVSTASADEQPGATLPDGTSLPTEAIEAPASVTAPGGVSSGLEGNPERIVATASTSGIPSAALAAYQRAETVINAADKTCNLSWQLVAAIGRVESNHGRANGNTLNSDGLAQPGIYGVALDGKQGTAAIADTDAGQYDADAKYDRAVGPMQFIPSTWSVVGVDADGDAKRNPQDIDDAALATAVYLCSGPDDLSSTEGQRSAVFRYNHSQAYVDLVLSVMNAYLDGDFTSVPNGTTSAGFFVPDPNPPAHHGNNGHGNGHGNNNGGHHNGGTNGGNNDGGNTGGDDGGGDLPTDNPTDPGGGGIDLPDLPLPGGGGGGGGNGGGGGGGPIEVLTPAVALAQCVAQGVIDNPLTAINELQQCVDNLLNP
jgi:hypothetical protein